MNPPPCSSHPRPATLPLRPLIAEYSATFGVAWGPVTQRKHRDDYARFLAWLEASGIEATTDALAFLTLAAYVEDLRRRPKVTGVWRGAPDALARSLASGASETLSANSVNGQPSSATGPATLILGTCSSPTEIIGDRSA